MKKKQVNSLFRSSIQFLPVSRTSFENCTCKIFTGMINSFWESVAAVAYIHHKVRVAICCFRKKNWDWEKRKRVNKKEVRVHVSNFWNVSWSKFSVHPIEELNGFLLDCIGIRCSRCSLKNKFYEENFSLPF